MSWGSYSSLKCNRCGLEYSVENSTLIMNRADYDKCPLCNSDGTIVSGTSGTIVSSTSMLKAMKGDEEKFKNRPKRFTGFKKSKDDKTTFLCDCGYPVLSAFFDNLGYLHTSLHADNDGRCFQCKRLINEELLNEDEVDTI